MHLPETRKGTFPELSIIDSQSVKIQKACNVWGLTRGKNSKGGNSISVSKLLWSAHSLGSGNSEDLPKTLNSSQTPL